MKSSDTISVSFPPACYFRTGYFIAILVLEHSLSLLIEATVDGHPQLVVAEKDAGVGMAHLVEPFFRRQMRVTDKLRAIRNVSHWNLQLTTSSGARGFPNWVGTIIDNDFGVVDGVLSTCLLSDHPFSCSAIAGDLKLPFQIGVISLLGPVSTPATKSSNRVKRRNILGD